MCFAICNSLVSNLEALPTGINHAFLGIEISLAGNIYLTMISVYTKMSTYFDDEKEFLYHLPTPENDKIFLLGDFNAKILETSVYGY